MPRGVHVREQTRSEGKPFYVFFPCPIIHLITLTRALSNASSLITIVSPSTFLSPDSFIDLAFSTSSRYLYAPNPLQTLGFSVPILARFSHAPLLHSALPSENLPRTTAINNCTTPSLGLSSRPLPIGVERPRSARNTVCDSAKTTTQNS